MEHSTGLLQITVNTLFDHDNDTRGRNENAELYVTPERREYMRFSEEKFREPIMTFINDAVGKYNWQILFKQFCAESFECVVTCETEENFETIERIINERIKHTVIRSCIRAY